MQFRIVTLNIADAAKDTAAMPSAVRHTAQEARVSIVNRPWDRSGCNDRHRLHAARRTANWPPQESVASPPKAGRSVRRHGVWVYRLPPIAWQTVTTATPTEL
jgi:hypothetical protein